MSKSRIKLGKENDIIVFNSYIKLLKIYLSKNALNIAVESVYNNTTSEEAVNSAITRYINSN